jgi:hypothetical protein
MNINDFNKNFSFQKGKIKTNKSNKYNNLKVVIDGYTFDSKKEAEFYGSLKLKKQAGFIKDFKMQVKYEIKINNIHIANYFMDFEITNNDESVDYVDIKAKDKKTNKFIKTGVFALKKRLVEAIYGIKISMI